MSAQGNNGRFELKGRVALITGSSKGLGKAMALSMGASGAKVVLNYQNSKEHADKTFEEFQSAGYEGIMVQADATSEESVKAMVARAEKELGPVDIVVANATCAQPFNPVEDYDWAFFETMHAFFVKSPYLLVTATVAHMKKQRWGRIINIGSEVFQRGVPNFTAYVAAKGGQSGLNRSLASELARWGITVNMVSPGWIPVERHEKDPQAMKDAYLATVPAARWGVPKEIGDTVAFLASDEAAYISGQNICVNGAHTVA